jgi:hypothetical protein
MVGEFRALRMIRPVQKAVEEHPLVADIVEEVRAGRSLPAPSGGSFE